MTLDEFKSSGRASELGEQADALFKLIDRNRDSRVSLAEYRTQPDEARFPLIDLDGDQSLSLEEFIGTIRDKKQVAAAEKLALSATADRCAADQIQRRFASRLREKGLLQA